MSWEEFKGNLYDGLAQARAGIGHMIGLDGYYDAMGISCEINRGSLAYKLAPMGMILAATVVTGGLAAEFTAVGEAAEVAPEMETAIEGTDEGAVEAEGGEGCFVAGTPLQIAGTDDVFSSLLSQSLTEPIEQADSGKTVMTADPTDGIAEAQQPTAYFIHQVHDLVTLSFADSDSASASETITCTPNHPFFTSHGIEAAGELKNGDVALTRDGHGMVVVSEKTKHGLFTVYNLTVNKDHTYYVGNAHGGIWVHNTCPPQNSGTGYRQGELPAKGGPPDGSLARGDELDGQIRDYDEFGNAEKDFDFGHDHGAGDPHAHDWDWTQVRPRGPGRPILPGE